MGTDAIFATADALVDTKMVSVPIFQVLLLAGLSLASGPAPAQGLDKLMPAKTVQIIVPNAPGGGLDFIARLIAPRLSETVRQNVIVENRASANGIVGT